jgi:hypothetical protein
MMPKLFQSLSNCLIAFLLCGTFIIGENTLKET